MTGIYLHIPFCKKACTYCNFHFSTSLKYVDEMVEVMCKELQQRSVECTTEVGSIYWGGGTPSVLEPAHLERLFNIIYKYYRVKRGAEITLEINPDDVIKERVKHWIKLGINRASVGIQSFDNDQLLWMNRAHRGLEAKLRVWTLADCGIENISIDLIYGLPKMSTIQWRKTLMQALALPVQHVSSYCLTVEPKTALQHKVQIGSIQVADEESSANQFDVLVSTLTEHGFSHYEISNFGLPGYEAVHNSNYWKNKPYIGIGPSAHSYDGKKTRRWNIANNQQYMRSLASNQNYFETEILTSVERINEWIMTGLRTHAGCEIDQLDTELKKLLPEVLLKVNQDKRIQITPQGFVLRPESWFLADGVAADLFLSQIQH